MKALTQNIIVRLTVDVKCVAGDIEHLTYNQPPSAPRYAGHDMCQVCQH